MAAYLIRVVLHGATSSHYTTLHERMLEAGAKRSIVGTNGVLFDLPDGEYVLASSYTTEKVRDGVADIAAAVKGSPAPSVLVAAYSNIAWQLRPVPGQS